MILRLTTVKSNFCHYYQKIFTSEKILKIIIIIIKLRYNNFIEHVVLVKHYLKKAAFIKFTFPYYVRGKIMKEFHNY